MFDQWRRRRATGVVATLAAGPERALRLRHSRLLDGTAG